MKTMKLTKFLRLLTNYTITLILSVILCFGGFPILSSQADAIPELAQTPVNITADSFVAAAVSRTGPAVVRIDTETVVTRQIDPFFDDPFFRDFFGQQFQPPRQQRITGQGSGFIIDRSGIILTNAHVVNSADKVTVTLKDGRTFNGQVKGTDEVTDLAVVAINPAGNTLPVAPLGDSTNLKVGDWAIAVGNPVGLDNTVTLGINSKGEVIAINTAIRADAMGIGFAIPINKAKALEKTLASGQKVPHPYIGVQMINLTPEIARKNNRNPNSPIIVAEVDGILVVQVVPNSPAERARLRRGDVIVAVNGQPVKDGTDLQKIVENVGINASLRVKLYRGDRLLELTVKTEQLQGVS